MNEPKTPPWQLPFVLLLAAVFRTYPISLTGFGVDEAVTALHSTQSIQHAIFWDAPNNPPLQHILLNLAGRISDSEAMLRMPGALFGIATVYLVYLITRRLISESAAFWAGMALALSPFHIIHSMNARMYSALMFFCLASVWFLLLAPGRQSRRSWAAFGIVTAFALYTHYLALSFLIVHWLMVFGMRGDHLSAAGDHTGSPLRIRRLAAAHANALALFLPWGAVYMRPQAVGGSGLEVAAGSAGIALFDFLSARSFGLSAMGWEVAEICATLLAGLLLVFGIDSLMKNRPALATMSAGFLVPFVFMFVLAVVNWRHTSQHYVLALPMFHTICALGFSSLKERWGKAAWVYPAPTLILAAVSFFNWFHNSAYPKTDWRSACRSIAREASDGDVAIFDGPNTTYPFAYYASGSIPYHGLPTHYPANNEDVSRECRRVTRNAPRIWLVQSGSQAIFDPEGLVEKWCRRHYRLQRQRRFGSIKVQLFEKEVRPNAR